MSRASIRNGTGSMLALRLCDRSLGDLTFISKRHSCRNVDCSLTTVSCMNLNLQPCIPPITQDICKSSQDFKRSQLVRLYRYSFIQQLELVLCCMYKTPAESKDTHALYDIQSSERLELGLRHLQQISEDIFCVLPEIWTSPFGAAWSFAQHGKHGWHRHLLPGFCITSQSV